MSRAPRQPDPVARFARWGAALGAALALFVATSVALAAFTGTGTGGGGAVATKRVFAGVRSAWPWDVRDASGGGAETNSSDALSYADTVVKTTGNWTSAFSATRFDDFDFSAGRPAGIAVSSATFNFTFAPSRSNDDACFYIEVRRASTNALLGTHGSSATPSACATSGAQVAANVSISAEVTTTDIANDLRIRVYANQSGGKAIKIELAAVSVTTPTYTTDGTGYASVGNFATTFNTARYLKLTPNAAVPTGATITSAQAQLAYKSVTGGDQTCWYFEVYNGATLIGTHGSSGTPVSCNSTASYVTDSVPVPEVDTAAEANNVVLKVYIKNSGSRKATVDLVQLDVNYYLN
jgi:hypothetical protein